MKLLRIVIGIALVAIGIVAAIFAASLVRQLSGWIMIISAITLFCISIIIILSGIQIVRGGNIKEILSELFRAIGR